MSVVPGRSAMFMFSCICHLLLPRSVHQKFYIPYSTLLSSQIRMIRRYIDASRSSLLVVDCAIALDVREALGVVVLTIYTLWSNSGVLFKSRTHRANAHW